MDFDCILNTVFFWLVLSMTSFHGSRVFLLTLTASLYLLPFCTPLPCPPRPRSVQGAAESVNSRRYAINEPLTLWSAGLSLNRLFWAWTELVKWTPPISHHSWVLQHVLFLISTQSLDIGVWLVTLCLVEILSFSLAGLFYTCLHAWLTRVHILLWILILQGVNLPHWFKAPKNPSCLLLAFSQGKFGSSSLAFLHPVVLLPINTKCC